MYHRKCPNECIVQRAIIRAFMVLVDVLPESLTCLVFLTLQGVMLATLLLTTASTLAGKPSLARRAFNIYILL